MRHSYPLALLLVPLLLVAGCTDAGDESALPATPAANATIILSSAVFPDGGTVPADFTCDGEDRSPALNWTGVPPETVSLVLVMDDPDAPYGTFTHWLVWNISPSSPGIGEGIEPLEALPGGMVQGTNDFGEIGYRGPCPPAGPPHRYIFTLYALDTGLDLPGSATREDIDAAMKGHILATGEYMGTYERAA